MLEDHSSRWSAAASPGGLIGMVLMILSLIAVVTSILSLTGRFELALSETVLYVILAVSSFTTFIFLYLLFGYIRIGYRIDAERLTITWGLWSTSIPYDEIEAVEPATDVLDGQQGGWQPFWPGYYVGSRNTDIGNVRAVATHPPRRQILVARTDGEIFAISPERPLLFMEELARSYHSFHDLAEQQEPEVAAPPVATQEREEQLAPEEPVGEPVGEAAPRPSHDAPVEPEQTAQIEQSPSSSEEATSPPVPQQEQQPPDTVPSPVESQVSQVPAFGAASVSEPESHPAPLPELDPVPYVPDPELEIETSQYPVWYPDPVPAQDQEYGDPVQQFVDAGWTSEYSTLDVEHQHQPSAPAFSAPQPVIKEAPHARRQVLQPLTRAHRGEPAATSPALRATLHRDPISLMLIGAGALATAGMATFILVQYQDVPATLTLHWNVDGLPGRVGEPREVWTLPIIAGLVLVANIGLAWSIAMFDRFAARLMLGSTLIVHMVTWVALIMLLQ